MKILSLNLWFSDYLRYERSRIFVDYILNNSYDIIFLQEAIAPVLAYIYQHIKDTYPYIHTNIDDDFYGLAFISKYEIKKRKYYDFKKTRMKRGILIGTINDIVFGTTHLESEFGKRSETKIWQFNNCIELLSKYERAILIGDTNLTKKNNINLDLKDFKDIYLEKDNSKENLYTYDGIKNPLLSNKIRSRVDRAFYKGNIKIKKFDLEKEFIMSDHFGIKLSIE